MSEPQKNKCIWRGKENAACGQDALESSNYCKDHSPQEVGSSNPNVSWVALGLASSGGQKFP